MVSNTSLRYPLGVEFLKVVKRGLELNGHIFHHPLPRLVNSVFVARPPMPPIGSSFARGPAQGVPTQPCPTRAQARPNPCQR